MFRILGQALTVLLTAGLITPGSGGSVAAKAAILVPSDPVANVLYDIYKGDPQAFKRAEGLYQKSSDRAELARLATVLAFAPADQVRVAPAMYALYAFQNDQTIAVELKSKLGKLAGQALFSQGNFEKASRVFATALALPHLKESDQEYFTYQMAWCDLNQDRHRSAMDRMAQWLKLCRECQLKKEMIGDLGKAYGEIAFTKSQVPPAQVFGLIESDTERAEFFQGVLMSLKRVRPLNIVKITSLLQTTPLFSLWIGAIFNNNQFAQIPACEKVTAVKGTDPALWPVDAVRKSVLDCARLAYEKISIPSADVLAVAEALPHRDPLDLFIQSELLAALGRFQESCLVRVRSAVPDSLKLDVYVSSAVDVCAKAKGPEITDAIAGLLMSPMLRASAAQSGIAGDTGSWLSSYLAAMKAHEPWRTQFQQRSLNWLHVYHPDWALIRSIIQDPDWDLNYRLRVWREAPFDGDMATVQVLAEDILKSKAEPNTYTQFLSEVQSLLPKPSAAIALLKVRGFQIHSNADTSGWLDLYKACVATEDWQSLGPEEQAEVFKRLLTKVPFDLFLQDWPVWISFLQKNERLFEEFLAGALAAEKFPLKDFASKYTDPQSLVIGAAIELKANSQAVIPPVALAKMDPKWSDDFAAVNAAREAAERIRGIRLGGLDDDQMAQAVESGLDLVTKSLRQTRAHKWALPAVASFQQSALKGALESFRAQLAPAPSYAKISQLVKRWEARL